ncbi:hypothetical protein D3C78_1624200 [compost metagenome]
MLAVLTTRTALPAKSARVFCSPLMVVHGMFNRLSLMASGSADSQERSNIASN